MTALRDGDAWEKYKHLWLGMGVHWITHVSAADSIWLLKEFLPSVVE
jgi:hypothetical protein